MRGIAVLSVGGLLAVAAIGQVQAQQPERLRLGVLVSPDTVTVGDHFLVSVRVRGPAGTTFEFPSAPVEGRVEAVETPRLFPVGDTAAVEQTMIYRMVAWDTGAVAVPLDAVTATMAGRSRALPLQNVQVYVRSVLPADTALHQPRPARSIFGWLRPWWHWLLAALIALALLALLLWLLSRLRRRRRTEPGEAVPPIKWAESEFDRIESLHLLEAGERGRYVALYVEVMRDYLAARLSGAPTSLTSTELLEALRERPDIPVERMAPVLAEADLIKFARRTVTRERARQLAGDTRVAVSEVEQAVSAREHEAAVEPEREAVAV